MSSTGLRGFFGGSGAAAETSFFNHEWTPMNTNWQRADKQDSQDHFSDPLNKPNDTKITFIISCFLACFVGKNLIMR